MLQIFHQMWAELLEGLVYGILDHPTIESFHSLNHWNVVVCEDAPAGCAPQKPLELVSQKSNCKTVLATGASIVKFHSR